MNIEQRDQEIIKRYINENISMAALGKEYDLTSSRIQQIISSSELPAGKNRRMVNHRVDQAIDILVADGTIGVTAMLRQNPELGLSPATVYKALEERKIELNWSEIRAKACMAPRLNGRVPLTRQLLFDHYIRDNMSTVDIAKKFNYSQSGVYRRIKLFNLDEEKRRRNGKN